MTSKVSFDVRGWSPRSSGKESRSSLVVVVLYLGSGIVFFMSPSTYLPNHPSNVILGTQSALSPTVVIDRSTLAVTSHVLATFHLNPATAMRRSVVSPG